MTKHFKKLVYFSALVLGLQACQESESEKHTDAVNKTDSRRNTTGTENTLNKDSTSPGRDSAQHGGPTKPGN